MNKLLRRICLLYNCIGIVLWLYIICILMVPQIREEAHDGYAIFSIAVLFWLLTNIAALFRIKPAIHVSRVLDISAFLYSWYYVFYLIKGHTMEGVMFYFLSSVSLLSFFLTCKNVKQADVSHVDQYQDTMIIKSRFSRQHIAINTNRLLTIIFLLYNVLGIYLWLYHRWHSIPRFISDTERLDRGVYGIIVVFWLLINIITCLIRVKPLLYLSSVLNAGAFLISWYYLWSLITVNVEKGFMFFFFSSISLLFFWITYPLMLNNGRLKQGRDI